MRFFWTSAMFCVSLFFFSLLKLYYGLSQQSVRVDLPINLRSISQEAKPFIYKTKHLRF